MSLCPICEVDGCESHNAYDRGVHAFAGLVFGKPVAGPTTPAPSSRPGICPPGPTGATGPTGTTPNPPTVGAPSVSENDFGPVPLKHVFVVGTVCGWCGVNVVISCPDGIVGCEVVHVEAHECPLDPALSAPYKLRGRFKLTLKAPYALTHPLAKQPGNLAIYVYGEEFDDHILVHADIDPTNIVEIERAGQFDPGTNTIVDDPEVTVMIDRQISA